MRPVSRFRFRQPSANNFSSRKPTGVLQFVEWFTSAEIGASSSRHRNDVSSSTRQRCREDATATSATRSSCWRQPCIAQQPAGNSRAVVDIVQYAGRPRRVFLRSVDDVDESRTEIAAAADATPPTICLHTKCRAFRTAILGNIEVPRSTYHRCDPTDNLQLN